MVNLVVDESRAESNKTVSGLKLVCFLFFNVLQINLDFVIVSAFDIEKSLKEKSFPPLERVTFKTGSP